MIKINKNIFFLNSFFFLLVSILFLKFFIFIDFFPLHDELIIVERHTELQNFLWRGANGNHTLNSFFALIIKNTIGYNLLYYRFFSFLSFVGILLIVKQLYPNLLIFSLTIIIILTSNILTNYIWIFRGYYVWGFLTVLSFFLLKQFHDNSFDNLNFKLLMIINLILSFHAIYVLYTVLPILIYLFFLIVKKKDKEKIFILLIYFICPLIIFYFIIIILEGFTMIFWDKLNINYLINNFFFVVRESFVPGIKSIFFSNHLGQYNIENNFFLEVFENLKTPPANMDPEYNLIFIYFFSFSILFLRVVSKKYNFLDFILIMMIIIFFLVDQNPEIRVHIGIIYFFMMYVLDFIFQKIKTIKKIKILDYLTCAISLFFIFNVSLNENFNDTKKSFNKAKYLYSKYDCDGLNSVLSDYEIWIVKNTHIFKCNFYYDFELKKNILKN